MPRMIVIFGPQGSGKGTQAELLAQKLGCVYISTGNLLRQAMEQRTPLGVETQGLMQSGKLVPDKITNALVAEQLRLPEVQSRGCILDGYPRTLAQAEFLDQAIVLTDAVVIEIPDAESVRRIVNRLVCVCGRTYHTQYQPPKQPGLCDACGRALFVRDDDKPAAIKKRLALYHAETEPIFERYSGRGILKKINGVPSIPEVHQAVALALGI
jgi:adenylate kinase